MTNSSIQFIPGKEVDTDKWDRCIQEDPNGLIYNTSWYLDTLGAEWDALVKGDYEAVMPLSHRTKYGQSYIFRPFGVQQQGLSGKDSDNPALLEQFIGHIPSHFKYIELYTNASNSVEEVPSSWSVEENVNLILDLNRSYESLYESFSSQTKRNIKKSARQNFKVFEHDPPEVLIRMFRANQGKRYSVSESFYITMLHLMHVLIHKRRGFVWTVQDERNSTVAGMFVMEYKGRSTLLFSATDEFGRETSAMSFAINEFLTLRAENGGMFDFEGSNTPGLKQFYSGFGAVQKNYHLLKINRLPIPLRWFK